MWFLLTFAFFFPAFVAVLCTRRKLSTISRSKTLQKTESDMRTGGSNEDDVRRKSSTENKTDGLGDKTSKESEVTDPDHSDEIITRRDAKKKNEGEDSRAAWTRYALERPCRRLAKQFKKIKKFVAVGSDGKPLPTAAYDANELKNRYTDVLCVDTTRVILKNRENDYIHASWFSLPDSSVKYICAQGPLKETVEDFWAMIHQEKTKMIVMLCPLVEGNTEKCAIYWPVKKGDSEKYGDYTVTQVEQRPEPLEGVALTYFDVQFKKEDPLRVWHVLVTWWPDQLAPNDARPMLELHKWVRKNNDKNRPMLVHCSAGVGRTATFVGLDYAVQRIKEDFTIEMLDIVKEMRVMRAQAVQSHVQYIFLHVLVFEYFVLEGIVTKDEKMTQFLADYTKNANKRLKKRKEDDEKDAKELSKSTPVRQQKRVEVEE